MPSSRFQLTECRSCSDCVMVLLNRICAIIQVCTDQLLDVDCVRIMQCWLNYDVRIHSVANYLMCCVLVFGCFLFDAIATYV